MGPVLLVLAALTRGNDARCALAVLASLALTSFGRFLSSAGDTSSGHLLNVPIALTLAVDPSALLRRGRKLIVALLSKMKLKRRSSHQPLPK